MVWEKEASASLLQEEKALDPLVQEQEAPPLVQAWLITVSLY